MFTPNNTTMTSCCNSSKVCVCVLCVWSKNLSCWCSTCSYFLNCHHEKNEKTSRHHGIGSHRTLGRATCVKRNKQANNRLPTELDNIARSSDLILIACSPPPPPPPPPHTHTHTMHPLTQSCKLMWGCSKFPSGKALMCHAHFWLPMPYV